MKNLLSIIRSSIVIVGLGVIISGTSTAAFTETTSNIGNTFITGTAGFQLLNDRSYGTYDPVTNKFFITDAECAITCTTSIPGTDFGTLFPGWHSSILMKSVNTGTLNLKVFSDATITGGNPLLADWLQVRVYGWDDLDSDGVLDPGENTGEYGSGPYTIREWIIQDPYSDLGQIGKVNGENEVRGFIYKFSVKYGIPGSLQGSSISFDFSLNGTTEGAIQ
ncbi:MAG: hypothetical protein ACOCXQ_00510 [Patescibacteria group bacterium]